jgi:hypothetical protein
MGYYRRPICGAGVEVLVPNRGHTYMCRYTEDVFLLTSQKSMTRKPVWLNKSQVLCCSSIPDGVGFFH